MTANLARIDTGNYHRDAIPKRKHELTGGHWEKRPAGLRVWVKDAPELVDEPRWHVTGTCCEDCGCLHPASPRKDSEGTYRGGLLGGSVVSDRSGPDSSGRFPQRSGGVSEPARSDASPERAGTAPTREQVLAYAEAAWHEWKLADPPSPRGNGRWAAFIAGYLAGKGIDA